MYSKYLEKYHIKNDGTIINMITKKELKQSNYTGYARVALSDGSKFNYISVHRLVAFKYIENPLNKKQVNHKDGNKLNNHFTNLEWVTDSENQIHAIKNGLSICLTDRGYAGRTKSETKNVRKDSIMNLDNDLLSDAIEYKYNCKKSCKQVGELLGYSKSSFERLLKGKLDYYLLLK